MRHDAGRTNYGSGGPREAKVGYSRAVRVGNVIHVAGTTALDEEGRRAHGEVLGQVRPAATMIEVARLIDPRMLVEIEAEATVE
jgi:enamine deaminase RidA (YjgF/YER057c/UK114 family)